MKKLIVSIPLFTLLLLFSFCTKESNTSNDASQQASATTSDVAVTDRADCYVRVTADMNVTVCGLPTTSTAACNDCTGASKFQVSGTYLVFVVDDTVLTSFMLTNNNATAITGYVSLSSNPSTHYCYILQPNETRCFSTIGCGLFVSQAPDC